MNGQNTKRTVGNLGYNVATATNLETPTYHQHFSEKLQVANKVMTMPKHFVSRLHT